MKIGILTFHFGINYGGVLQCYALQTFLEQQGHTAEIINFVPPNFCYSVWWTGNGYRKSLINGLISAGIKLCYAKSQREKFRHFREKYLNLSAPYTIDSLSSIRDQYSAIIVGSDQIWNPSQRCHGTYFLHPFTGFQGKRISYAPCCAMKSVDSSHILTLKNDLLRFNSISVRNIETQEFVWDSIGLKPEIVVDPTLLIDVDFSAEDKLQKKSDYILAYILGAQIKGGHSAVISQIKKQFGNLPVYAVILSENKPQYFSWANKSLWDIDPAEWVMLFKKAKYIYTDSYHGLLFALKYKKPFMAYYAEKERASRFIDLSVRYKLDTFIVNSVTDAIQKESFNKMPNYTEIDSLLSIDVKKSVLFLKNAIEGQS